MGKAKMKIVRKRMNADCFIGPGRLIGRVLPVLIVLVSLAYGTTVAAQDTSEEDVVLAVVQQFFDSMTANDKEAASKTLMPHGQYYSVREDPKGLYVKRRSHQEYLEGLSDSDDGMVERIWNPTVLIHGRIAVVWVPYDFHMNGEFRHCGVDAFSLVKTDEGWRIAGIVYTVEPSGCVPSPLGPLQEEK
ncbi:MAG: nuclear transport factor 2 family protein [Candidatus Latescibacterota bacterium]|nr:MAG: nuclear transport factor 2 family protein [Candidatus Latescibacterota bacterium]